MGSGGMNLLSTEQVLTLAPDASSVKAGHGLANPGKWSGLGRNDRSVWGECQGSGKEPYRTQADLSGPAFNCSCPSQKFPCKHSLGLLLLLAGNPAHVPPAEPPQWVVEWIAKRDASQAKKAAREQAEATPPDAATIARREVDQAKRAARREDRVRAGLQELQTWLGDLVRQGLAHAKQHPAHHWDAMAARMIDAQAPGIARRLRAWPGVFAGGEGWAEHALERAGELQWLLHGFARLETLPEDLRASVRAAIGITTTEPELDTAVTVSDQWQVVGQRVEDEDNLRVQQTWLVGAATRRPALCLSFAAMNQPLDVSLVGGTAITAELAFYPSAAPLRAVVRQRQGSPVPFEEPAACASFAEALDATATLLAGVPWLERAPWFVRDCIPLPPRADRAGHAADGWQLRDRDGSAVPLARSFANPWPLLAVSGGTPVTVFGEWQGHDLLPLSVLDGQRFIPLGGPLP